MAGGYGTNGSAPSDPKLAALREAMAAADGGAGVHAYIIPSEDPHMVPSIPPLRRHMAQSAAHRLQASCIMGIENPIDMTATLENDTMPDA